MPWRGVATGVKVEVEVGTGSKVHVALIDMRYEYKEEW